MKLFLWTADMGELSRLHGGNEEGGMEQQGVSQGGNYCSHSPLSYRYHLKRMPNLKLSTSNLRVQKIKNKHKYSRQELLPPSIFHIKTFSSV